MRLRSRDLEEMMAERGLLVDHTTIYHWVQRSAPQREKRCRPHLKTCNDSWKVDETYVRIKKVWISLYRAVDSQGNTIEFLLSSTRDAEVAKHFFVKAFHGADSPALQACPIADSITAPPAPRVINIDKNAAYPKAMADLNVDGILPESVELRQVKYLNTLIEQNHRFIKRLTKPGMSFFSDLTVWRTLQGFEVMNMIRKGQIRGGEKRDVRGHATLIATHFGGAA
jgi:transposase, IS6 family